MKEVTKDNLMIISKSHAHSKTITKTPVKFRKNWHKTVGGVAYTRYLLLWGEGRTEGRIYGMPINDSRFFKKAWDKNESKQSLLLYC